MTLEELKQYDGKDGRPAYVGYKGKVYDLSKSDFWEGGSHMGRFEAGTELTEFIDLSPHGEKNLFRYPVVAELSPAEEGAEKSSPQAGEAPIYVSEKDKKLAKYRKLYIKFHPHPMMVHFPMGMFSLAFFAQVISLILGNSVYGFYLTVGSIVAMVFGTIFTIPAILSGLTSFVLNYNAHPNVYLKRKMILSAAAFLVGVYGSYVGCAGLYEAANPNMDKIMSGELSHYGVAFSIMAIVIMPIIAGIGYNGGKLTWPENR